MDSITSIQIIGTQRSGSNLLRLILNQFDEISAPHPPHVLKTFAEFYKQYGDLSVDQNFELLARDVADFVNANPVPWSGSEIDYKVLIERARNKSLLSLYETLYKLKAEFDEAKIWCCKSMFNEYYAREIEAEGIRPYYIYLYRDGRDVAASFKNAIIGPKHAYFLASNWVRDQERAWQVQKEVGDSRFCSIRYEDLIENPENILKNLSANLGLKYSSKLLEYHKSFESKQTASSGELWKNVTQPIIKSNKGKYKSVLTEEEIEIYENVAGNHLQKLNYVLDNNFDQFRTYSESEIESFRVLNKNYQEDAKLNASDRERDLRKKQEELIESIKERFSLSADLG